MVLGDLMDGAKGYDDEEFALEYKRFRKIIGLNQGTLELHVAGNHDIGLGHSFCASCARRFTDNVGPLSYKVAVGNVTFIAVDTVSTASYVDAHSCTEHRRFRRASHSFTSNVSDERVSLDWRGEQNHSRSAGAIAFQGEVDCRPRVLLSHIPLYRPEGTHCGPGRAQDNGYIRYIVQYSFQTTGT